MSRVPAAALAAAMLVSGLLTVSPGQLTAAAAGPGSPSSAVTQAAPATVAMLLPALANAAYGGYTTVAYMKNLGSVPASVRIDYVDSNGAAVGTGDSASIQPQATWIVRQDNGHAFGINQAGSGRITSDQLVASFVNEFAPGSGDATSYSGIQLPSGTGSTLYAPAIANKAYGGYTTGIGLLNLATSSSDITITYRKADGTVQVAQTLSAVPAGAYRGIYSGSSGSATDANLPANFAGTATIASSAGSIAAVVNEVGPGGQFSSYDAVAQGATTLYTPVILNNAYGGFNTGIGLQNLGTATANVMITYAGQVGAGTSTQTFQEHPTLAPNGYDGDYNGGGASNPVLPNGFHGSATVKSDQPLAAIVNEVAAPPSGSTISTQSTSYNSFTAGVTAAHLPLVENAGPDGLTTSIGIENIGSRGAAVTIIYYDATTGSLLTQKTVTIPAGSFLGAYTPNDLATAGTRATAAVRTPDGTILAVIANEVGIGTFMSYDAGGEATGPPPDPATVAPPVNTSVATDVAAASAFLYSGSNPVQTGVAAGTIQPLRASVVRGRVLTPDGQPLAGVALSILGHPEFGTTLSRTDGMFDMAMNGGGYLTFNYAKDGYLPAQRQIWSPWQDYTQLPDVALNPLDPKVTAVDLTSTAPMQPARGTTMTDGDGTRQATVLFPQGTHATMKLPDGSSQPLTSLHVRATEYTVGPNGPIRMPAELPPTSAYTYAVDLTADEAVAAGATQVSFDHPLPFYVEDFLGYKPGVQIPNGSYDMVRGQWVGDIPGLVIKVLSITGGLADLDIDGSGTPASTTALAALGINDAERQQVATLYSPGQSLWRVPMTHFSPHDCNMAWIFPADAIPPNPPSQPKSPNPGGRPDDCQQRGSIVGCIDQKLGEAVNVTGTPYQLHYQSARQAGRAYQLTIPLSGSTVPPSLKDIWLEVKVSGHQFATQYPAAPNQIATFSWDHTDAYGHVVQGSQPITVRIGFGYLPRAVPAVAGQFAGLPSPSAPPTGVSSRREFVAWQSWQGQTSTWDAGGQSFGGWTLSVNHVYDSRGRRLYKGDGSVQDATAFGGFGIATVAGTGAVGNSGDGGPATSAQFGTVAGIATGPDGSLYIEDTSFARIRRVGPDGIITTVAGGGTLPAGTGAADGHPATQANLGGFLGGLAFGPDGSYYIVSKGGTSNGAIYRVGPDGIFTTVPTDPSVLITGGIAVAPDNSIYYIQDAPWRPDLPRAVYRQWPNGTNTIVAGGGNPSPGIGDGGPSIQARMDPRGIALGPDGSLYIADLLSQSVRRVDNDGIIKTVAGQGLDCQSSPFPCQGSFGDGGPATQAGLQLPLAVAVGSDGSIYVGDQGNTFQFGDYGTIRYVGSDGVINTIAGTGQPPPNGGIGDNGFAIRANLTNAIHVLALSADGRAYLDGGSYRIRRLSPVFPGMSVTDIAVPSSDGSEVYIFDRTGRHLHTLDGLTQALRYQFGYDSGGRLTTVTDTSGNVTSIERNSTGAATAIVAPGKQRTALALGSDGLLSRITNPASESAQFTYAAGGLMATSTDPRGGIHRFTYDSFGRLTRDQDPAGGVQVLARTDTATGFIVTRTTAQNRVTSYQLEQLPTKALRHTLTDPAGGTTQVVINPDGSQSATYPDGSTVTTVAGPDPRWGVEAPNLQSSTVTLPNGLTQSVSTQRTTTLSDLSNPLSIKTLTATLTVNGRTSKSVYDSSARTITQTSPASRTQVVTLDAKGRVVNVVPATGVDAIARSYDASGRLASTGEGGQSWTLAYDALNRLISNTDALGNVIAYAYDSADRLTKTTLPGGEVYQFGYDANGNRTQVTMPNGGVHQLGYTPVDLESSYTPPGGTASTSTYDADRELTAQTFVSHGTVSTTYDAGGRVTSESAPDSSIAFGYASNDPTDRLATMARTLAGGTAGQTVAFGYGGPLMTSATWGTGAIGTFSYTYNNDFFLTGVNLTSGTANVSFALTYDTDGLPTGLGPFTLARGGPGGALSQMSDGKLSLSLGYDSLARPNSRTDSIAVNSTTTVKPYDAQLTFDAGGRITGKTETINGSSHTYAYQYDKDGQLTKVAKDGNTIEQYTYDANSNRASQQLGTATAQAATYDAQDRLTQRGSVTYLLDDDGFLKQRGSDTFTYTARGELLSATVGAQTVTYGYDGLGRRATKKVGTTTTQYLYGNPLSPFQLTQERDPAGVLTSFYYDDSGLPVALDRSGSRYYVSTDQLGTPRVVSDAAGTVVKVLDYDAFGAQLSDSNPGFDLPIGFAGGLADPVSGLVHFAFRDYEPASGRWTARDPALFSGGQGNLYAYVANDPILNRDPTGLFCIGAAFYDVVGAGFSVCVTGQGVSTCEEAGLGFGGGITVDPFGGLKAAGNDLVAEVGASCGPLSVSAGVSLNHCGDINWNADASLGVGPLGVSFDKSGNASVGLTGELGPASAGVDSNGDVGVKVKLEGPQGDVRPKGFNGSCSIGGRVAGRACQQFGF